MRVLLACLGLALVSMSAQAAEYKCYASKYPSGMNHTFADGYIILNVSKNDVNFKYYFVNTVANETALELDVNYKLQGVAGGNSRVKDMIRGELVFGDHPFPGDTIDNMYFDQALISTTDRIRRGIIGKLTFTGQGFNYDWNICYNSK